MMRFLILVVATLTATLAAPPPAAAAPTSGTSAYFVRDKTDDGYAFVSGGVSVDDRQTMQAERASYSLWVTTVARPSGAYLADVQLKVTDLKRQHVVVDRTMEGPWYLIDLPPGRYQIEATFRASGSTKDQTLKETVNVSKGVVRQSVLRFDSKAEVSPDERGPSAAHAGGASTKP